MHLTSYQEFALGALRFPEPQGIMNRAYVPEHSLWFMRAMSSGEPFLLRDYLFFTGQDWLMAIGYPLSGEYRKNEFEQALQESMQRVKPVHVWAVSPELPPSWAKWRIDADKYYVLSTQSRVHPRLLNLAKRAEESLRVEEGRVFTSSHQDLWDEFVQARDLPPQVYSMYERTQPVLAGVQDLILLNAWDQNDNLAACLLLDTGPERFVSYLIGAHSRKHHTPYATDLLFREMLALAQRKGKEFIHLGQGVNPGIKHFKVKWGGKPEWSYDLAVWTQQKSTRVWGGWAQVSQEPSLLLEDKWKIFRELPEQHKLSMIWELEKNGRRSWIIGAAHFCRYSFRIHLYRLYRDVDMVLCEGPLDRGSMDFIADVGKNPTQDSPRLAPHLSHSEIQVLENVVCGTPGFMDKILGRQRSRNVDVYYYLAYTRHWLAFFTLWSEFLKRQGWEQSVDLEAWNAAHNLGKYVLGMETIPEQLRTMESIPVQRVIHFLRNCQSWEQLIKKNEKSYLKGDLDGLMQSISEFPSRTESVIDHRDERFLHRMLPYLEQGRCAVFVGTAHMHNLRYMLKEAGFNVRLAR